MGPQQYQLKLPQGEVEALGHKIEQDFQADISDHDRRIRRWTEYAERWRAKAKDQAIGDEETSNFLVPLIQWLTMAQVSKEADSLFGEDAEVVAIPVGPSDHRNVHKIGRYMTWLVLSAMDLTRPFLRFTLTKILFGRSIAYRPWVTRTRIVKGEEQTDYDGPGFFPLHPNDFICPAEDVDTLHDFSHVIRRYRVTPDKLLEGEAQGLYQGIHKNFETILQAARSAPQRDSQGDEIKAAVDDVEGVNYENNLSHGDGLTVLEWYGRRRMLKAKQGGQGEVDEYDLTKREMRETELVVRYLPDCSLVIGVQKLEELYPEQRRRRPFSEAAFLVDDRYWTPGLCELVISAEDELSTNHNQATEAAQYALSPAFGYRPAGGAEPETLRMEPGLGIPMDNPDKDMREFKTTFDTRAAQWKEATILSYVERLTGLSDLQLGRQLDRPNAPRTLGQSQLITEESNVRMSLATKLLSEDMGQILSEIWELDSYYSDESKFFRVSEEDANGLFDVKKGGSYIERQDRSGQYDFQIKFATSAHSKVQRKQETLARYQLDLTNPLIASNPLALWKVTNQAHKALGDPNFAQLVPKPPEADLPVDPREEWTRLLQGEDIRVNPLDNDELHMIRHQRDIQESAEDPRRNDAAHHKLRAHYHQHIAQLQQKQVVQALAEQAAEGLNRLGPILPGLLGQPDGQQPGGEQPQQPGGPQGGPEQL